MKEETLRLDLRGKTAEEVVQWFKSNGLNAHASDITDSYKAHDSNTDPVTCVWLTDKEAGRCTFVLWDGRECKAKPGQDLHLFDPKGTAEWGMARTLNVMR